MIGAGCNPHTEVERKTRFLMAGIVPGRTAGESVGAQPAMFSPLPAGARGGVTHDNGTEFARHTRLRDGPGRDTCFADCVLSSAGVPFYRGWLSGLPVNCLPGYRRLVSSGFGCFVIA